MNRFTGSITKNGLFIFRSTLLLLFSFPLLSIAQSPTLSIQRTPKEISKHATLAILEDRFGFIWLGGNGLYRFDGYNMKEYLSAMDQTGGIGAVKSLLEDREGIIWIGSMNGLYKYDRTIDQVMLFSNEKLLNRFGKSPTVWSLFEDSGGRIWVGGEDRLFVIDHQEKEEVHLVQGIEIGNSSWNRTGVMGILETLGGQIFAGTTNGLWEIGTLLEAHQHLPEKFADGSRLFRIDALAHGRKDTLWLATPEGLWFFNTSNERFRELAIPENDRKLIKTVMSDANENLWIATKDEILQRQKNGDFQKMLDDKHYLLDGVQVMHKDRQGNLWLGSYHGAGMLALRTINTLPFYQIGHGSPYHDNHFYRICQDSSGGFWFRMFRSGLGYCPNLGGPFEIRLQPLTHYFGEEVKGICTDPDGNIWVITYTNGLFLFEKGKKEYQFIDIGDSIKRIAIPHAIFPDYLDKRVLWISTQAGLLKLDRFDFTRKWFRPKNDLPWLDSDAINMMGQADDGNIWCSLYSEGKMIAGYFDISKKRFDAEKHHPHRPPTSRIYQFQQVAPGEMWVATNRGIILVDTRQKSQRFWTTAEGFPTNDPLAVTPDRQGNVWFTAGKKIYRYNGTNFESYEADEAIERFDNTSVALISDGRIAFGGVNGIHILDPRTLQRDTVHPKVFLTDFRVFNQKKVFGKSYELIRKITLEHSEKVFSFEFAGLHFSNAPRLRYRHILEGFEENWVETGSDERRVTYTNLAPGNYTFKATTVHENDFDAGFLIVHLRILPPWYATWWAIMTWLLIFLGSIYGIYHFQFNRRLALSEAARLKDLDHAKSLLYTNITHEFRTPLTIILGMAQQVKNDPRNWFNEGLKLIHRNGQQLLGLVNQLLDLSKLESGYMPLKPINGDIVEFLEYLSQSFHSYADSKDIRLHFTSDFEHFEMDYDPEKLQSIVSNLFSNAIKFTPAGGDVYLDIRRPESGESAILLTVRDNGPGIAPKHLPHIFDRFYQVDPTATRKSEGTGIGLALIKELVKLMGGGISVESQLDKGTKFSLKLPVRQIAPKAADDQLSFIRPPISDAILLETTTEPNQSDIPQSDLPLLLLIEDNADVITYLCSFLSGNYRISTATNGREGIEKAIEMTPDLIVSDVMMPEKDGFEVCEFLKGDERTNHIPVILLTAKSDQGAKLKGLSYGADAYLAKPFSKEELLVRMEKLIALRKKLQAHYENTTELIKMVQKPRATPEELFLRKIIAIVEENLADEHFGLPDLCRRSGLSRSQLFRKLKAVTGKSTTAFIRSIRLAKGKELLEAREMNVSEVAFAVGFGNPAYFSRMFQQEFGTTPGEVRK